MRNAKVILVAAMTFSLAGCLLSGKPKTVTPPPAAPQPVTPAPPPEPLSIPQTTWDLPAPQPLNPDALKEAEKVETPPALPKTVQTAPTVHNTRSNPPAKPPDLPPPADPPPAPEPRPPIQEIVPADVQKQLETQAEDYKTKARTLLAAAQSRRLNATERSTVQSIQNWLKQTEQAEANKDMRAASEYAEKAYTLAKELRSGK